MKTRPTLIALVCASALLLTACPSDDAAMNDQSESQGSSTSGGDPSGDPSTDPTSAPASCSDTNENDYVYEPPGECFNNPGCPSCACVLFQDNPPTAESMCADALADKIRITATIFEFPGQTPLPDQAIRIVGAVDIGTLGPEDAPSLGEVTANGEGKVDITIDAPQDSIGVVAIVRAEGYRDTATGLAKPESTGFYETTNAIHDLFVVPESILAGYSDALAGDPEVADYVPLGDNGGVVGIARNRYTGQPSAGVEIVSLNASTFSLVRYLEPDGSFGTAATSETGVYVILNPGLAEEFEARQAGVVVSTRANKAGSGPPGIFTMNLTIDTDPGSNPFE